MREPSGGSARNTRRWVAAIAVTALALTTALSVGSAGAKSTKAGQAKATTNLTMWFWGNDDAPGANKWLAAAVKAYEAKNPSIKIKVVAQATSRRSSRPSRPRPPRSRGPTSPRSGRPGPVLTQVWGGAITAISDLVPKSEIEELAEHVGEHLRREDLGDAALPDRDPVGVQQGAHAAGRHHGLPGHEVGPDHLVLQGAARQEHHAVRVRQRHLLDDAADDAGPRQARTTWCDASTGKASFTAKKYANFEDGWKQMVDAKCFNDDVSSVGAREGPAGLRRGRGRDDDRHRRPGAHSSPRISAATPR